jgi:small-conductance mechanosensitive channel
VFLNLTDNWVELHLRVLTPIRGIREVKDEIQRNVLSRFEEAGIAIASATFEITALPPVAVSVQPPPGRS